MQTAPVGKASSQPLCFVFWCLHRSNSQLSLSALLMSPYSKINNNQTRCMENKCPPAPDIHSSLIISTCGASQLCIRTVAFGCFIVYEKENAQSTGQGGNYPPCVPRCFPFSNLKRYILYITPFSTEQTCLRTGQMRLLGFAWLHVELSPPLCSGIFPWTLSDKRATLLQDESLFVYISILLATCEDVAEGEWMNCLP